MRFAENLRALREAKGWSQREAAERAGVPLRSLEKWEQAVSEPRLTALVALARLYRVSIDKLVQGK